MDKKRKESLGLVGWIGKWALEENFEKLRNDIITIKPSKQNRNNFKQVRITIEEI